MGTIETRTLDIKLTKQEILERSRSQADLVRKIEDVEAKKSEMTKTLGAKVKELTGELQAVAREVRAGVRYAEVEVTRTKDMERAVEETIRVDTGEIINTRPLTPAELQLDLISGGAKTTKVTVTLDKKKKSGAN